MNIASAVAALALGASALPVLAAPNSLAIHQPTIVILVDAPAEITKNRKSDENYDEATGDFAVYANRMVIALKGKRQVSVRWSSARLVTFAGTSLKPVERARVGGGWGYVFYRPGSEPVVIEGVAVDDHLVCTAIKLFKIEVEGYNCGT